MIIDISNSKFRQMFSNEQLYLPISWEGNDFVSTLEKLYHTYQCQLEKHIDNDENILYENVKACCAIIIKAVKAYLDGFPSESFICSCNSLHIKWNNTLLLRVNHGSDRR